MLKYPQSSPSQTVFPSKILDIHWSVFHPYRSAFFKMSYEWNPLTCKLSALLLSDNNMHLKFGHIIAWINSLFLFITENSVVWRHNTIHSSVEWYLSCFKCLMIMNKVAKNILCRVFLYICFKICVYFNSLKNMTKFNICSLESLLLNYKEIA